MTPPSTGAQGDGSEAPPNTNAHEQSSGLLKDEPTMSFSAQNARATVSCVECRKMRVIYFRNRLRQRQQLSIALALSEYEYTCGSHFFPPSTPKTLRENIRCRPNLQCTMPVEVPCYGGENLGRKDLCAHCGTEGGVTDADLRKKYKPVLPICTDCRESIWKVKQEITDYCMHKSFGNLF